MSKTTHPLKFCVSIRPSIDGASVYDDSCTLVGEFWKDTKEDAYGIGPCHTMTTVRGKDYDFEFVSIECSLWRQSALDWDKDDPHVAADRYMRNASPRLSLCANRSWRGLLTVAEARRALVTINMLEKRVDALRHKEGCPTTPGQILLQYARTIDAPVILWHPGGLLGADDKRYETLLPIGAAQEIDQFVRDWVVREGKWGERWRARTAQYSSVFRDSGSSLSVG